MTYWFDESRGTGFCLIDAPDIKTAMRVHDEAHGDVAKDVIEVDLSAVQAFLGRVSDPEPSGEASNVTIDSALRAIMFTDIVGSTSMTERLGDARSVEMVRAHDALVRRALKDKGGHVVKHTGDGIMASQTLVPAILRDSCSQLMYTESNGVNTLIGQMNERTAQRPGPSHAPNAHIVHLADTVSPARA